jgi:hypothetical protein
VSFVLDLHIAHDRVGSSTDPTLNGHLKYRNNLDQSLNDAAVDTIRKYRVDYNNNPPSTVSFMPVIVSTSGRLHSEFVRLLFLQTHRETDRFFCNFRSSACVNRLWSFPLPPCDFLCDSDHLKSKDVLSLAKAASLRITFNLDGVSIISKSHTHPSHSQTSRLLTSSLSLGIPVPRSTQCIRGM